MMGFFDKLHSGKYVAAIFGNFLLLQEVGNADEFGGVHSFPRLSPHYAVLQQKKTGHPIGACLNLSDYEWLMSVYYLSYNTYCMPFASFVKHFFKRKKPPTRRQTACSYIVLNLRQQFVIARMRTMSMVI
jgi:hypothetical protein